MASVIFVWWGMFLGFKLTKLFGICHFSGAKVLIITMNFFFFIINIFIIIAKVIIMLSNFEKLCSYSCIFKVLCIEAAITQVENNSHLSCQLAIVC